MYSVYRGDDAEMTDSCRLCCPGAAVKLTLDVDQKGPNVGWGVWCGEALEAGQHSSTDCPHLGLAFTLALNPSRPQPGTLLDTG